MCNGDHLLKIDFCGVCLSFPFTSIISVLRGKLVTAAEPEFQNFRAQGQSRKEWGGEGKAGEKKSKIFGPGLCSEKDGKHSDSLVLL